MSITVKNELDEIPTLTEDSRKQLPDYDIRSVISYCAKNGIETDQLSDEELEKFKRNNE